jgi:hypothetical protein
MTGSDLGPPFYQACRVAGIARDDRFWPIQELRDSALAGILLYRNVVFQDETRPKTDLLC